MFTLSSSLDSSTPAHDNFMASPFDNLNPSGLNPNGLLVRNHEKFLRSLRDYLIAQAGELAFDRLETQSCCEENVFTSLSLIQPSFAPCPFLLSSQACRDCREAEIGHSLEALTPLLAALMRGEQPTPEELQEAPWRSVVEAMEVERLSLLDAAMG